MESIGGVAKTIATPLSDQDIHEYLPEARIIKYSELAKYPSIAELLPEVKSYVIMLYEDSPNKGHWVQVCKPREDLVVYFDSYGGHPDAPLNWTPESRRIGLGEGKPLLSKLLDECSEEVCYNKIHYQKEGANINDCGRWCVLWTLKMKAGYSLDKFYKFIKAEAKGKMPFDAVVSKLIP